MTATDLTAARSGVYRTPADVESLREAARSAGLAWIEADLSGARAKADAIAALAAAGAFPAGFGGNWDALADSLGDFSWRPAAGYVLRLRGGAAAQRALAKEWATLVDVLRNAAREWQARGKPFVALIDDAGALAQWRNP